MLLTKDKHLTFQTFLNGVIPNAVNLSPDPHIEAPLCHLGTRRDRVLPRCSEPRFSSEGGVDKEIFLKLTALGPY